MERWLGSLDDGDLAALRRRLRAPAAAIEADPVRTTNRRDESWNQRRSTLVKR
ncbi:MAG: hypothetical protein ACYC9Q_07720 [Bacillota bacterium]